MISERARLVTTSYAVSDLVMTTAAFALAHSVRDASTNVSDVFGPVYAIDVYAPLIGIILPVWALTFYANGLYGARAARTLRTELARLFRAILLSALALACIIFVAKLDYVSRPLVLVFLLLDGVFVLLGRGLVRWFVLDSTTRRRVVVAGERDAVVQVADQVDAHKDWGLEVAGLASDGSWDSSDLGVTQYRVMGRCEDVPGLVLRGEVVDEVIVVPGHGRLDDIRSMTPVFQRLEELGIVTRLVVNFLPRRLSEVSFDECGGIPMLTFTTAPRDEVLLFVRRCADVTVASMLLVLLSPLFVMIAALIRATSRGPILFRQTRIGLHGRRFTFLKFRSMEEDAESRKAALAPFNEMDGPAFKMINDPRITRVGRWLRRTSFDELPQLWNILKGDMSFVGPRPAVVEEVRQYAPWQRRRLSMQPGLTCLWQVNGRNELTFDEWMRLDLEYIDNWSLWLDLKIALKTIPAVLRGRGAR